MPDAVFDYAMPHELLLYALLCAAKDVDVAARGYAICVLMLPVDAMMIRAYADIFDADDFHAFVLMPRFAARAFILRSSSLDAADAIVFSLR